MSSDDEKYLMTNNVAETTPGRSDRAARLLTAAMLYLNSPPEAPKNWGQINPNLNDYHSDPMDRLPLHFGYCTYPIGGANRRKRTQSTPISPMWLATYSLSYHMVSEWMPVFPLAEMLLDRDSQKQQVRPFTKKSYSESLLEPIMGFWQALTQNWIPQT